MASGLCRGLVLSNSKLGQTGSAALYCLETDRFFGYLDYPKLHVQSWLVSLRKDVK